MANNQIRMEIASWFLSDSYKAFPEGVLKRDSSRRGARESVDQRPSNSPRSCERRDGILAIRKLLLRFAIVEREEGNRRIEMLSGKDGPDCLNCA